MLLWIALKFCIFVVLKQQDLQGFRRVYLLWIALKFCIFVVLKQHVVKVITTRLCCELLSNFVSLSSWNNLAEVDWTLNIVVNCSQILYLCRPETTFPYFAPWESELWIALKFCIFVVLKQLGIFGRFLIECCELLSNFVSLSSWNNERDAKQWELDVVNCSQILYLCRPETTGQADDRLLLLLWIALKFCIFVVLKQRPRLATIWKLGCELLSNFVSLSSWNNESSPARQWLVVVNCSQILYLCRPETTTDKQAEAFDRLWIALKFCIFVVLKQRWIRHSFSQIMLWIALKFCIFVVLKQPRGGQLAYPLLLWIALKFCIFVVLKQPQRARRYSLCCCELLSNFVSLSSWNNYSFSRAFFSRLWIALKFCIFVVLKQLFKKTLLSPTVLWIALKFCIFVVLKQQPRPSDWHSCCCELLSNFVSLSSWNNHHRKLA